MSCPFATDIASRRRSFLRTTLGLLPAGGAFARHLDRAPQQQAMATLPTLKIGGKTISRLIPGANPIEGYSYGTSKLTQHMRSYFTTERTTELILRCEQEGMTAWQSHYSAKVRDALLAARERGSKIQWIALTSAGEGVLKDVMALKPIAICHHGGVTDRLFRDGKREQVHDFVKQVHDAGLIAGISAHNPDNLAAIEDGGWENEFYMACFYNLTRAPEEIRRMVSERVLGGYLFFAADPERMTARIRQLKKPCLGFKILAAGRRCGTPAELDKAFAFAYQSIKPSDGVIVGLYPAFSDEAKEDADLARKYAGAVS